MSSKVRAGRLGWEAEPVSAVNERDEDVGADPEIEVEAAAVAAWFGALPAELQAYFDHEARCGREAYRWP
ncbi:MAG: hypothetical protein QM820_48360 [Minicystis sp.]